MRILWVKVGGLWPANSGGRLRSYHIINELSREHEVSVVTTRRADEDPAVLVKQLSRCKHVVQALYSAPKHNSPEFVTALVKSWFTPLAVDLYKNQVPEMKTSVARLLQENDFDIIIADFLTALPNLPKQASVPVVLFTHNVEYMIWKRLCANETNLLKRLLLAIEWRKMKWYEASACREADVTLTVSDTDKEQFMAMAPDSIVHATPTGVDIEYFMPASAAAGLAAEQPLELVFSGSMDWFPNEDAMLWFTDSILPLIRRQVPEVTLTIVGRNPSQRMRELATRAIKVTGTVDDVRPYVHRAAVYIVPLRVGGGTRIKIYEALAMGKAVVSTTVGAEGLPLTHDRDILLADTPEAFAQQVVNLIAYPATRTRLGQAGRALVETEYSWRRVARDFEGLCRRSRKTTPQQTLAGGNEA
ncbi:MAG: hypothetical protein RLZZ227_2367 [Pseudomonadota bacterium]|jgi:sugar transferase (PEP-CTERM/EpsH1 system associated)